MPVRIENELVTCPGNELVPFTEAELVKRPLSLKKKELREASTAFDLHYKNSSNGSMANPNYEFAVNWAVFSDAIFNVIRDSGINQDNLVLSFIHRYDASDNTWCLWMDFYETDDAISSYRQDREYALINRLARFELKQDSLQPVPATDPDYDSDWHQSYFDNVRCDGMALNRTDATAPKHICCLSFPWKMELFQLWADNQLYLKDSHDLWIVFASCSFDMSAKADYSEVHWPHGMALYFRDASRPDGTKDLLNDSDYVSLFYYRASDFSTLCPPNCKVYILPELYLSKITF